MRNVLGCAIVLGTLWGCGPSPYEQELAQYHIFKEKNNKSKDITEIYYQKDDVKIPLGEVAGNLEYTRPLHIRSLDWSGSKEILVLKEPEKGDENDGVIFIISQSPPSLAARWVLTDLPKGCPGRDGLDALGCNWEGNLKVERLASLYWMHPEVEEKKFVIRNLMNGKIISESHVIMPDGVEDYLKKISRFYPFVLGFGEEVRFISNGKYVFVKKGIRPDMDLSMGEEKERFDRAIKGATHLLPTPDIINIFRSSDGKSVFSTQKEGFLRHFVLSENQNYFFCTKRLDSLKKEKLLIWSLQEGKWVWEKTIDGFAKAIFIRGRDAEIERVDLTPVTVQLPEYFNKSADSASAPAEKLSRD